VADIVFENVSKTYHVGEVKIEAVKDASFTVRGGTFVAVLGPSGAGKTTVLNLLGGMDRATGGRILVSGRDIVPLSDRALNKYRRDEVGFVFQFYNLIPNLTAKENIQLAAELSKSPIPTLKLLETIGMSDRANHFPSQMSGGQQQRIAIARALAKNPDILLCDEPTGALDFSTGIQVLRLLKDFNQQYHKTVVIITHNAGIGNVADRVFHIRDGLIDRITVNEHPIAPEEVSW